MAMNISSEKLAEELFPRCWAEVIEQHHRIIPAGPESVDAVLEAAKASGGVFGEAPLYNAKGEIYIEPEDGRIIDFCLWAESKNQELVRTLGACEKLSGFTMVINADTPRDLLIKMYDLSPGGEYDGEFEYDRFIREVPKWLNQLGWAYVPLAGEDDLALFIVSREKTDLISKVERRIKAAGGKTAFLQEIQGLPVLRNS